MKTIEELIAESQRIAVAINELPLTVSQKTELGGAIDQLCWCAGAASTSPLDLILSAPLRDHLAELVRLRAGEGTLPLVIPTPGARGFLERSQPREA